jgi:DNA-binding GntR family transcriptional regulator
MNTFQIGSIANKRKYLRDHIFDELQQAIYGGKLKSGERLTEKGIAEELGVSRTPVREALYRLASSGLIKMIPHRGFLISHWSSKEIEDVIELRSALEVFAVKLAVQRISEKEIDEFKDLLDEMRKAVSKKDTMKASCLNSLFHDKIIHASKNKELSEVIEPIKNKIYHFRIISISSPNRLKESFEEHKKILNAIRNKDSKLAQELIAQHIRKVGLIIKEKIKEKQEQETIKA